MCLVFFRACHRALVFFCSKAMVQQSCGEIQILCQGFSVEAAIEVAYFGISASRNSRSRAIETETQLSTCPSFPILSVESQQLSTESTKVARSCSKSRQKVSWAGGAASVATFARLQLCGLAIKEILRFSASCDCTIL